MVALNFNVNQHEASLGGGVTVKPAGWYTGMIVNTTNKNADKGASTNAFLEMDIRYQDGTKHIKRFNLWNASPDAVRIANQELSAIVQACGRQAVGQSTELHNLTFEHYLSVEEQEYKGRKISANEIRAVKLPDGKVIGDPGPSAPGGAAAPAAANGGGFAPPPAPAAGGFAPPAAPAAPAAPPAAPNPPQQFVPQPAPGQPGSPMPAPGQPDQPWGQGQPPAAPPGPPAYQAAPPAPPAPGGGGWGAPQPGAPAQPAPGGWPQQGAAPAQPGGPWGAPQ